MRGADLNLYTAQEVAAMLGVHQSRVRQLAAQFGIGWRSAAGKRNVWLFTEDDVQELRNRPTTPGPRKQS